VKIGLYFGSFNPIHIGHLIIANHILNDSELERIWFIVSPLNPFKESQNLMNEYDRLHLVKKAIEEDPRLKASDIEFLLAKPSYTVHTLAYLKEKYPEHSFSLIMGSDGFQNLHKWKNPEIIVKNYPIVIYRRLGFEVNNKLNAQITVMNAPLLEISSTHIRELVKVGKSIKYLVPSSIEEDILSSHFFGKDQKK
jgi:nicotinate-nucleotide adenylyltransferase